jgi:hypothetical protein
MEKIPPYLLKHKLMISPYLGSSAYGETWGDSVQVKALFLPKRRLIKKNDGSEVICTAIAYVSPDSASFATIEGKVSFSGREYTIRGVEPFGSSYIEITLEP